MTVEVDEPAPIPHSINWRGIGTKAWPVIQLILCAVMIALWVYVGFASNPPYE